jgi:hypothetical protein
MYPRAPRAAPIGGINVQSGVNPNVINRAQSDEIRREAAQRRARKAQNPHIIANKEAAIAANEEKKLLRQTHKSAIQAAKRDALQRKRLMKTRAGLRLLEQMAVPPGGDNPFEEAPGTMPNILPVQVQPNLLDTMIS